VFEANGAEINHQWGKSSAAEGHLNDYLQGELLVDASYSSLLKPLWDIGIFRILARWPDAVPLTHSCNVAKPWCLACPKCAYVWLQCFAFLPLETLRATFGTTNLADDSRNRLAFRQMLGLEDHTPFECVGQIDEARLAFALARGKGLAGTAVDELMELLPQVDVDAETARLSEVGTASPGMPGAIAELIDPILRNFLKP